MTSRRWVQKHRKLFSERSRELQRSVVVSSLCYFYNGGMCTERENVCVCVCVSE